MPAIWPFAPHRRWESKASAFVDGELGAPVSERFAHHLANCERCSLRVQGLRQVKALVAGLPEASAPRSFAITPAMLASLQPPAPPAPAPRWALHGAQVLAGAAFAAFFALVVVDLSTPTSSHTDTASRAAPVSGAAVPLAPLNQSATISATNGLASPPPKGIASPTGGGVGAQAVPSGEPGTPAVKRAAAAPSAAAAGAEDTYSAPTGQPATVDGPLSHATHQANDGRGAAYRAFELGSLALGAAAAVAAVVFARRLRRS